MLRRKLRTPNQTGISVESDEANIRFQRNPMSDRATPLGFCVFWLAGTQADGLIVQAKYSNFFENLVQKNRNNLRNLACVGVQTKVSEFLGPFFCGSHTHRVKRSFESIR